MNKALGVDASGEIAEKSIHAYIGEILLFLQVTEKAIRITMTYAIQKDQSGPGMTYDQIVAQEKIERRKTLGYFLSQLRSRVSLDVKFDEELATFLELRNQFVHHLSSVPGWDLDTTEGLKVAHEHLTKVLRYSSYTLMVFSGIVRNWQRQTGVEPISPEFDSLKEFIDTHYTPHTDNLIGPKP